MFRPLLVGALISASMTCVSLAQDRLGGTLLDIEQATVHFVRLFRETCFENRGSPEDLRKVAEARQWKEIEGPFPFRNDEQQSTTLVAWDFWEQGVAYQSTLVSFDSNAPAVTCVLVGTAVNSNELPNLIQNAFGLALKNEGRNDTNRFTQFAYTDAEGSFVIGCSDMSPVRVLFGQCALVKTKPQAVRDPSAKFSVLHPISSNI